MGLENSELLASKTMIARGASFAPINSCDDRNTGISLGALSQFSFCDRTVSLDDTISQIQD